MRIDKALLARRFGRAAPGYDRRARVQERAADSVVRALAGRWAPGRPPRILDLGSGTGLLTARLLDAWPGADALGVDLSSGMVDEARRRLAPRGARFAVGDVEAGLPEGAFELVASSMALQWVAAPGAVLRCAGARLAPGGVLAVAVPVEGTLTELRGAYAGAARALDVADWRHPGLDFHPAARWEAWARAAFDEVRVEVEAVVERHPRARAVLESIRGVGANDCAGGAGPAAVRLLRHALALYDAGSAGPEGVPATWRLCVLVASRPRR